MHTYLRRSPFECVTYPSGVTTLGYDRLALRADLVSVSYTLGENKLNFNIHIMLASRASRVLRLHSIFVVPATTFRSPVGLGAPAKGPSISEVVSPVRYIGEAKVR